MKKLLLLLSMTSFVFGVNSQTNVSFKINHKLGASSFAFNSNATNNLGDVFNVSRLQYYISQISIIHDGGNVTPVSNKWLLVDAGSSTYEVMGSFNITNIEGISFGIGVEQAVNHLDPATYSTTHPLAPKSPSMHWGWASGYRFLAMEGNAGTTTPNQIYELHGLGDGNYHVISVVTTGKTDANGLVIELNADYEQAIKDINVASGPISHGEVGDAKKAIENFRDFVFTSWEGNNSTSIQEDIQNNVMSISPNPIKQNEELNILLSTSEKNTVVQINDITGKLVQNELVNGRNKVQLKSLNQGSYMIVLRNDRGIIETQKLIVTD